MCILDTYVLNWSHTWQDTEIRLYLSLALERQPHGWLSGLARHRHGLWALWTSSCGKSGTGGEGAQTRGLAAHLEGPSQEMRHCVVNEELSWAQEVPGELGEAGNFLWFGDRPGSGSSISDLCVAGAAG